MNTELEKLREALATCYNLSEWANARDVLASAAHEVCGHSPTPLEAALLGYRSRDAEVAELLAQRELLAPPGGSVVIPETEWKALQAEKAELVEALKGLLSETADAVGISVREISKEGYVGHEAARLLAKHGKGAS